MAMDDPSVPSTSATLAQCCCALLVGLLIIAYVTWRPTSTVTPKLPASEPKPVPPAKAKLGDSHYLQAYRATKAVPLKDEVYDALTKLMQRTLRLNLPPP